MFRRRFYSILKRIITGPPLVFDPVKDWSLRMGGRVVIGNSIGLGTTALVVRDPSNCSLEIGSQSDLECTLVFEKAGAAIRIGTRTHIGGGTLDAACSIQIGDDVQVAFGVLMMDHNSHSVRFRERRNDVLEWQQGQKDWTHVPLAPIKICDKAWIGANVIILKGVTIGEGAVVGAGSVVTKSIPAWTIAAGNPAKVIRQLSEEECNLD